MSGWPARAPAIRACSRSTRWRVSPRPTSSFTTRWSMRACWRSPVRRRELEFAGKRGGRPSVQQADITARLIELARERKRVLRLKGGDPCMFGRGGEEAIALADAGIPYRIIPGITAGLAALAAASIPATMRGVNQAVIFVTGHADADFDWAALARTGQPIVIYMAMRNVEPIVAGPDARRACACDAGRRDRRGDLARAARRHLPARPPCGRGPQARLQHAGSHRDRRDRHGARPAAAAGRASRGSAVTARGLIVSAPRSSSGKTTVTLGLLGALRRKGIAVRAAKSGPDYIDPAFHAAATGAQGPQSRHLGDAAPADRRADRRGCARRATLLVIEGAMGLFDGVPGTPGRSGAAADLAARSSPAGAAHSRRVRASRSRRPRSRRASPRSIRRFASAASCSTSSAATAIAP